MSMVGMRLVRVPAVGAAPRVNRAQPHTLRHVRRATSDGRTVEIEPRGARAALSFLDRVKRVWNTVSLSDKNLKKLEEYYDKKRTS